VPSPENPSAVIAALSATVGSRYKIEREIGRGGMATVYLADDLRHGRQVALKVLDPELAHAVGPDRFLREIEIAARLSHPHIMPLFDSGDAGGHLFYVMPFVRGESLRQRLDRQQRLGVEDAVKIARDVAEALDHAHARGVVHRDIKPENILLFEGQAIVADFGIALAADAAANRRLTGTGLVVGTPAYMSPEQLFGEATDARSDQYSLACVVYEMLAGEAPHAAATPQAIVAKRLVDSAPSMRRVRSIVPASIDDAVKRALDKDPAGRFASVGEFARALTTSPQTRATCVAVLPFSNFSADPENEFFADGITEDVIASLSKIRSLKVISRTSVMPFKARGGNLTEIAATLGATTLLEGSVRRAGDRVRIVAQLIDAETDQHLWSETYDRKLVDIFEIQTDVALQIAGALKAELTRDEESRVRKEATTDLEAYQLYVFGRQSLIRFTPVAMQTAIQYFDRAVARDPSFALAYAATALAYIELAEIGAIAAASAFRIAGDAVNKAVALDDELAEAHTTLGYLRMAGEFDWAGSESAFKRSLELNPNGADAYDLYGRLCSSLGRFDDAISLIARAQELDPLAHRLDMATVLLRAGRYEEAIAKARAATDLDPTGDRAHATLGWSLFLGGAHEDGIAHLKKAVSLSEATTSWLGQLGEAYGLAGRHDEARQVLRQLEERSRASFVSPYTFAYVYTGLGASEQAIELLEHAVRDRTGAAYGIKGSFLFAPLRSHPRFQALLREMGLT
jgi:serine/threonine protein kinase/tetratricopeptide (TPR) repeat protein